RAAAYAGLKLAGLDDAPCHLAVFTDRSTAQGHGLGRRTMPEMIEYSAVTAIHTIWLAARAEGVGMGWVSILDPAAVAAILDVPASWKLIGYLCLGFPQAEDDIPDLERAGWEGGQAPCWGVIPRRGVGDGVAGLCGDPVETRERRDGTFAGSLRLISVGTIDGGLRWQRERKDARQDATFVARTRREAGGDDPQAQFGRLSPLFAQ